MLLRMFNDQLQQVFILQNFVFNKNWEGYLYRIVRKGDDELMRRIAALTQMLRECTANMHFHITNERAQDIKHVRQLALGQICIF